LPDTLILETEFETESGVVHLRGPRRHFTHSKVMAWVAVDRAIRDIETYGLPGDVERWKQLHATIHEEVCGKGYDPERRSFIQYYGGKELDASLLMIPLVGFLPADDERVRATVAAIERELCREGFVYRYQTSESGHVDGLPAGEGVFLACTFWLADNYWLLGRHDQARRLFECLLALCNDVGLLSEQYDPHAKRVLGNFPRAFFHVSLINTAVNLSEDIGPVEHRKSEGEPDAPAGWAGRVPEPRRRSGPGLTHPESRHHGKVIGGHAGELAAVDAKAIGHEMAIPVDPIQRKEGQGSGMRAADAGAMELPPEQSSHRAGEPFVQIADDDARPREALMQDVLADERSNLLGALAHLQPEVHVEDVEQGVIHGQVETNAAAGLPLGPREIEGLVPLDGQPRQHGVPIGQAVHLGGRPHGQLHAEPFGQLIGLGTKHLLDADQIGVDLLEDIGDPHDVHAPVEARAAMDVVARHRELHTRNATGFSLACQPMSQTARVTRG
jgi:Glycosyl hydrolases family 15